MAQDDAETSGWRHQLASLTGPDGELQPGAETPEIAILPPGCRILALGEADFTFSEALAASFGRPLEQGELVATSLEPEEEIASRYAGAPARLARLRSLGACVLGGVDATQLPDGPLKGTAPFDRIVFNFPLLPVTSLKRGSGAMDVQLANRAMLVAFLRAAAPLLRPQGLVAIANKDCYPYSWWRIEALPEWSGGELVLVAVLPWQYTEYPALYQGPCNVNRDAAVKPTDAVIFLFAHANSGYTSSCGTAGARLPDWRKLGPGATILRRSAVHSCAICGLDGLAPADLAAHEVSKIHRKRFVLERRWEDLAAPAT